MREHIRAATIRQMADPVYLDCGDWVDSCIGIVEHPDGRMELVQWLNRFGELAPGDAQAELPIEAPAARAAESAERAVTARHAA